MVPRNGCEKKNQDYRYEKTNLFFHFFSLCASLRICQVESERYFPTPPLKAGLGAIAWAKTAANTQEALGPLPPLGGEVKGPKIDVKIDNVSVLVTYPRIKERGQGWHRGSTS
jgi:hypothetical protein